MIYGSWLLTIKLSAFAIVIPMVFIWFRWIWQRSWKPVLVSTVCMLLAVSPWIARNILLTGYPVFPLPATDWFSFDWKVPLHHVQWHKAAVKLSAIDPALDAGQPFTLSVWKWFPTWFDHLPFIRAVIILGIGACLAGLSGLIGVKLYKGGVGFFRRNIQWLLALFTCVAGILFWLLYGPDIRFGFGFCLFFIMAGISWVCWYFLRDHARAAAKGFFAILLIALAYNYNSFINGVKHSFFKRPLTPRVASQIVQIADMGSGIHLSLVNYVDSWNTPLPCAPLIDINGTGPKLRGTTLKEGFQATR